MAALEGQDFPLDQIEVILVGSAEPANHWKTLCADDSRFHSVNVLVHGGTHYYELKNSGAGIRMRVRVIDHRLGRALDSDEPRRQIRDHQLYMDRGAPHNGPSNH